MPLSSDVRNIEEEWPRRRGQNPRGRSGHARPSRRRLSPVRTGVDEKAGKIFCLVAAPRAEATNAVHRQAHGLVPDEISEVSEH